MDNSNTYIDSPADDVEIEGLIKLLELEGDAGARGKVARRLGEIKDAMAVQPLIIALNDKRHKVNAAGWALGVDDKREKFITFAKEMAAWALGEIRDSRAVEPLIATLKDSDGRKYVQDALAIIGTPAVEPLIVLLRSNETHRGVAASILGKIRDTRAVEPLIEALQAKIWVAVWALGEIKDPRAVEPLIFALRNFESRKHAQDALENIGSPAVESLIALLRSKETHRWVAASVLGEIKDSRSTGPLISALRDSNGNAFVFKALVKIGRPAVEPLIDLLKDQNSTIRKVSAKALGLIKDQRAEEPLRAILTDNKWLVRRAARKALNAIRA